MIRVLTALAMVFATSTSQALVLAKCTAPGGKTLWASFGRLWKSGASDFTYFPVEIVVFNSDTELQDRFVFKTLEESLKIDVRTTPKFLGFDFDSVGVPGRHESLSVMVYNDQAMNSFIGNWATVDADGTSKYLSAGCTIY